MILKWKGRRGGRCTFLVRWETDKYNGKPMAVLYDSRGRSRNLVRFERKPSARQRATVESRFMRGAGCKIR
jgi:hypothetical protein